MNELEILTYVFFIVITLLYAALGIGTTRAIAKMKGRDIKLFEVFFWPIVLCVVAAVGDVA